MSNRTRFIEWCQRPSKIKILTFNPRNVVVLATSFIILAASITFGAWRSQVASVPNISFITPEDIETLIITTDTTLTEDYFNATIVIAADNVTLDGDGHMIIGPGRCSRIWDPNMPSNEEELWTTGILLEGGTGVTVKNCRVTGFGYGFLLNGSDGNTLQGNTANNNTNGFRLYESDGNSFKANTANNSRIGFSLWASNGNSFEANTANGNTFGFSLWESSRNSFEANTANDNVDWGFFMWSMSDNTFRNNTANDNGGDNDDYGHGFDLRESSFGNILQGNTANNNNGNGFALESSYGNMLEVNMANDNSHAGLHVAFSSNNTLTGNTASDNAFGMCIGAKGLAINNSIYHNTFVNNIKQLNLKQGNIENSVNAWDDGSVGNYWSDYTGVDANGDGIGDTPYVIDEDNVDRFPLMAPMSVVDGGIGGSETN
jgi:parallel beta-helix repeat protein